MTLINTNKVNFNNFKKESYNEKFIIFLFSFLPISLILGNSAINSNILIIDLFFLLTCYRQKQWSWIRNKYFYFFISIWIYLVINSIISENVAASLFDPVRKEIVYPKNDSIIRSVGFIRFIIFLFAVQYFFFNSKKIFNQIFLYWSIIIFVVLIDIVFEHIFGFNLLGFESPSSKRIVSFFKDELVVGGFILGFSFLISSFLFKLTKNDTVKKIFPSILLTIIITVFILLFYQSYNLIGIVGIILAFWIISNSLIILFQKIPNRSSGMIIAHLGIGLLILGITGSSVWQEEKIARMKINNEIKIKKYNIIFKEINEIRGPNYVALKGNFLVYDEKKTIITKLKPENRFYPITNNFTTEASIHTNFLRDLYIVLGEGNINDGWVVRIYYNPLVIWIWIGALAIFLGGIVSMTSNLEKLKRLSI